MVSTLSASSEGTLEGVSNVFTDHKGHKAFIECTSE